MLRTDILKITGDAEVLDASYYAIAIMGGQWRPTLDQPDGTTIPNPITAKDEATRLTREFWRSLVTSYSTREAQRIATEQATQQTSQALSTVLVEIEEAVGDGE